MTYARARQLNPMTGDWTWDEVSEGHATSPSPALEIVLLTLRTPLGSALADPLFGTDWDRVAKLGTRAEADVRAVIEAALAPQIARQVLRDLVVRSEEGPQGRMLYEVDFVDVRLGQRRSVRGTSP